jgi:hypothetical protein
MLFTFFVTSTLAVVIANNNIWRKAEIFEVNDILLGNPYNAISKTGILLTAPRESRRLLLYDVLNRRLLNEYHEEYINDPRKPKLTSAIKSASISKRGNLLALVIYYKEAADEKIKLRVLEASTFKCIFERIVPHGIQSRIMCTISDNERLLAVSTDANIHVIDIYSGRLVASSFAEYDRRFPVFAGNDSIIILNMRFEGLGIYNFERRVCISSLCVQTGKEIIVADNLKGACSMAINQLGDYLLIMDNDCRGEKVYTFLYKKTSPLHWEFIRSNSKKATKALGCCFSSNDKSVVEIYDRDSFVIRDISTNKIIEEFSSPFDKIDSTGETYPYTHAMHFNSNKRKVITYADDFGVGFVMEKKYPIYLLHEYYRIDIILAAVFGLLWMRRIYIRWRKGPRTSERAGGSEETKSDERPEK